MNIMEIFGAITLLLFVIAFILAIFKCTGAALGFITAGLISFTVFILIGIIGGVHHNTSKEPTALDVYRGKTTLEITYRDSVAIDSVVVYKAR
jgi:uncharacterized membrane protein